MSRLLLGVLLSAAVAADVWICPSDTILNTILGNVNCKNGTNDQCQQAVTPSSPCLFNILAPDDSSNGARLVIYASGMSPSDGIHIQSVYDIVDSDPSTSDFTLQSPFPFGGKTNSSIVQIKVTTGPNSNMTFGYYVEMFVPTFQTRAQLTVAAGQQAQFLQFQSRTSGQYWEVTTTTTGSTVTTTSAVSPESNPNDLLNFWIYEGVGDGKSLLGTVYGTLNQTILSQTKQITIFTAMDTSSSLYATAVVNDFNNYRTCLPYRAVWQQSVLNDFSIAGGCFTLLSDLKYISGAGYKFKTLYLTSITNLNDNKPFNGTAQVLGGSPITDPEAAGTLLGTYYPSHGNIGASTLPQWLPGIARTFIFKPTDAVAHFSVNPITAKDTVAYSFRSGFIITPSYPLAASNPSYYNNEFVLKDPSSFQFHFTVKNVVATGTLIIYGSTGRLDQFYLTPTNFGGLSRTYFDRQFSVSFTSSSAIYLTYSLGEVPIADIACPSGHIMLNGTAAQKWVSVPSNYKCTFIFDVADNSTIEVNVQAKSIAAGEYVRIYGKTIANRGLDLTNDMPQAHVMFPPNSVTIDVLSANDTQLSFTWTVTKRPEVISTSPIMTVDLRQLDDAFYLQMPSATTNQTWQISGDPKSVVLINAAVPPSSTPPSNFLNFWVYLGAGVNDSQLVGTLYDSYQKTWNPAQFVNTITVYCAMTVGWPNVGTAVFNQNTSMINCTNYKVEWSYGNDSPFKNLTLDARSASACVTILDDPDSLTDDPIIVSAVLYNAKPIVVAGAPKANPSTTDPRYLGGMSSGSKYYFTYPQVFAGSSRTIYLSSSSRTFQLTTCVNASLTNPSQVYAGRQGFIMSNNYPFLDENQDLFFSLSASSNFNLTFTIQYSDAPSGANLTVSTQSGPALLINISDPSVIGKSYGIGGQLIVFRLYGSSDGTPNRGSYITYHVSNDYKPNTTAAPTTTRTTATKAVGSSAITKAPVTNSTVKPPTGNVTTTPPISTNFTQAPNSGSSATTKASVVPASPTSPTVQTTTQAAGLVSGLLAAVIFLLVP